MDLYSLSAKHASLFHVHLTVRRDKNKRIQVRRSRSFTTPLQHFLGAGVPSVKMQLQANKQQTQCRHPQSVMCCELMSLPAHSSICMKAFMPPDSKPLLPKLPLARHTIPYSTIYISHLTGSVKHTIVELFGLEGTPKII